jgi:hypothetical protein
MPLVPISGFHSAVEVFPVANETEQILGVVIHNQNRVHCLLGHTSGSFGFR